MARPRQITDKQILETARECFLEHGPSISTTVIAGRLGISQAALFKRFSSKKELLLASLAPQQMPPWIEKLESGPDERDIETQLQEIAFRITKHFQQIIPCASVLRASGIEVEEIFERYGDAPPPIQAHKALKTWFLKARDHGRIGPCDPDSLAMVFLGALQIRSFLAHVAGDHVPASGTNSYLQGVIDLLWNGIAPKDPNPPVVDLGRRNPIET